MKIILVRHGETTANVSKLFCGHTDVLLTAKGLEQAKDAAEKLKNEKITQVYCSDLKRAQKTARIINEFHHLSIHKDERLREMYFGECEGYTFEQILEERPEAFKKEKLGSWDFTFPYGENLYMLRDRVMAAMKDIKEAMTEDDTSLVVVHAGVIRAILAMDIAKNEDAYWRFEIDNCGIVALTYYEDFCVLTQLNA